jgi:hypothetical protein
MRHGVRSPRMLRPTLAILIAIPIVLAACASFRESQASGADADSGTGADAATSGDASDAGAASPGAFCRTRDAGFCRDFDDVAGPFVGWTRSRVTAGSTGSLDTSTSSSAPASFHVTMPETAASADSAYAYAEQSFAGLSKWPSVHATFDVSFAAPAWKTEHRNIAIAELFYETGTTRHEVYVLVAEGRIDIGANLPDAFEGRSFAGAFPYGRWVPVSLDVSAPASGQVAIRLTIDGSTVIEDSFPVTGDDQVTELRLDVGLHNFNRPEPAFDLHYDNVVCTLE